MLESASSDSGFGMAGPMSVAVSQNSRDTVLFDRQRLFDLRDRDFSVEIRSRGDGQDEAIIRASKGGVLRAQNISRPFPSGTISVRRKVVDSIHFSVQFRGPPTQDYEELFQ